MNIGIIGMGIVGSAVKVGFQNKCDLFICDPKLEDSKSIEEIVRNCPIIFVGVPTPYNTKTKQVDDNIVSSVLESIALASELLLKRPMVVVKSAVPARIVRSWEKHGIDLVVSPEYLTERSCLHDFVNQNVMILGGDKQICDQVVEIYDKYSICNKKCKVAFCTAQEAAMIKYMENCFLAMKCIFNNEMKYYYDKFFDANGDDSRFNALLDVFYTDERMGLFPFKYRVPGPDGDRGFGGKCLPKDVSVMIAEAAMIGVDLSVMKAVLKKNDEIRTDRDWEHIEGALS